ncbi:MAG: DinB family protein [Lewinella sp.]|uniref:DinB family protein n=1 Tax=Lewinella sp. TaxID=2004506 RepID=UPI003D6A4DC1
MASPTQLAKQFREVYLNGDWIAKTNLKAEVEDMDWKLATTPVGKLNTIALLVFHMNYYVAGVLQVLEGGTLDIRDKYSFDAPPIQSQSEWEALLNKAWQNAEQFAIKVEQLTQQQLQAPFVKEEYGTYERNIDAMIEHGYYHLGQIVLQKKILEG